MQSKWVELEAALSRCSDDERRRLTAALRAGELDLRRLDTMQTVGFDDAVCHRPAVTAHLKRTDLAAWRDARAREQSHRQEERNQWLRLDDLCSRWGMDRVECLRTISDAGLTAYTVEGGVPDQMARAVEAVIDGRTIEVEQDRLEVLIRVERTNQFVGPRHRHLVDIYRSLLFFKRAAIEKIESAENAKEADAPEQKTPGRPPKPGMDEALRLLSERIEEAERIGGGAANVNAICADICAHPSFPQIRAGTLAREYRRQKQERHK